MANISPKLLTYMKPHMQEIEKPSRIKTKAKTTHKNIIFKLKKAEVNGKILKATKASSGILFRGTRIRITADFSSKNMSEATVTSGTWSNLTKTSKLKREGLEESSETEGRHSSGVEERLEFNIFIPLLLSSFEISC